MNKLYMIMLLLVSVVSIAEASSKKRQHRKGVRVHLATRMPRS
jgi:hypothetical protein